PVADDETVVDELALDRGNRADDALVAGRQETDLRNQEQRRVERRAAVMLHERAPPRVVAVREHVAADCLALLRPPFRVAGEAKVLGRFHASVERDPAHDARMRERARGTAHLPDALVAFLPDLLEMLEQ